MRLLLDQNVPPQVGGWLKQFDVDCLHVRDASLKTVSDSKLWQFAEIDQRAIVTKDGDFVALAKANPDKDTKIIWLGGGNLRNKDFELWIVARWPRVQELYDQGYQIIEVR